MDGKRSEASSSGLENLIRKNSLINLKLEEVIDIDKNLSLFSNEQWNLLNPEDYMVKRYYLYQFLFLDIIEHKLFIYPIGEKKNLT